MVCYAILWYGMVQYDMVWYGMLCYAMLWDGRGHLLPESKSCTVLKGHKNVPAHAAQLVQMNTVKDRRIKSVPTVCSSSVNPL